MDTENKVPDLETTSCHESLGDSHFQMPIRRLPTRLRDLHEKIGSHELAPCSSQIHAEYSDGDQWETIVNPETFMIDDNAGSDIERQNSSLPANNTHEVREAEITRFHEAIINGDREAVIQMLDNNMSVWHATDDGITPLAVAINQGMEDMMEILLERGASVHQPVIAVPPLVYAISRKHDSPRFMQLMLDHGADMNVEFGPDRYTALHSAAMNGVVDAVAFLASKGMDLEIRCSQGRTALMLAAENGHLITVKVLIAKGADIKARSDNGHTVMMWAANAGQVDIIAFLLEQGMEVDDVDESGITTLHILSCYGSVKGVRLLLDKGADVNGGPIDPKHFTPVMIAVNQRHHEIVQMLIDHGANLSLVYHNNDTALDLAIAMNRVETIPILLRAIGGPEYPISSVALQVAVASNSHDNTTAIMKTASIMFSELGSKTKKKSGHSWMSWVLEQGGDIVKPYALRSMFGAAVLNEDLGIVADLLSNGLDPNESISGGRTALTFAINRKNLDLVRILLDAGADPSLPSRGDGAMNVLRTPLQYAIMTLDDDLDKDTSTIDALLDTKKCRLMRGPILQNTAFGYILDRYHKWDHGVAQILTFRMLQASCNIYTDRAENGSSLLHAAVYYGHQDLVGVLLDKGADINTKDKLGHTPFTRRCRKNVDMLRFLIAKGADPFAVDKHGGTALHAATKWSDNNEVLDFLIDLGLDINKAMMNGTTPLSLAIIDKQEESAQHLLRRGASVTTKLDGGATLLHAVVESELVDFLPKLLASGLIDINATDDNGFTALALACDGYHSGPSFELAKVLLEAGADLEIPTKMGRRPLHLALIEGHEAIAELLVKHGADTSAVGYQGSIPLHIAAFYGRHTMLLQLLQAGEDTETIDTDRGHTPLCLVDDELSAKYLVRKGANVNFADRRGWTPLHIAVDGLNVSVFEVLIQAAADLEARTLDDRLSVRDRIMAMEDKTTKAAFWKAILESPYGAENISKDEKDYMERYWRKVLVQGSGIAWKSDDIVGEKTEE